MSTGLLDDTLLEKVGHMHDIDVIPFIAIEPVDNELLKQDIKELCERELHIVFTSNNGVKAVSAMIGDKPAKWKLFSIEGVTSRSVLEHFGTESMAASAFSGDELAKEILKDGSVREIIFFCGDLRRDELPERLRSQGVNVREVIVYNTVATPVKLDKEYDAVLFFSPSAVYSYVSLNKINESAVCFAIGNTTANTIKKIVENKVLIAQPPQKKRVVDMLLEYYN